MNGSADGPSEFSGNRSSAYPHSAAQSSKHSKFSLEERSRLNRDLQKYLAPEFTATRAGPGRSTLTYVEGWRIKNLANSVFGFDGWSSTITDVTVDFLDVDADGKVSVGVSVMVKVMLKDGTFHEDIGYGSSENQKSKASSFEKAKKEATTDGLKRALTSFGNLLGTCLYDKNYCRHLSMQRVDKPKFDSKDYYYPPETPLQELPRRATLQQQQQPQRQAPQQQAPVNGAMAAFHPVTHSGPAALSKPEPSKNNNAAALANLHAGSSNQPLGAAASGQFRPATTTTITPTPPNTASFHQSKQVTVIKGEQELDDEFFGPDLEEPRASQPESPRMSDFDLEIDDMMAEVSPIKGRAPGAVIGNAATSSGTGLPTTPRRTGSFTRSASSPSVVQTTPTKNATAAQRFQGQAIEPVPFKNMPATSSTSGSMSLKVANGDNPFLVKSTAAPDSSSSATSFQPNQGQPRPANPVPNPYAHKLPLQQQPEQQHWSKKDIGSSAIQRPTGSGQGGANDSKINGNLHAVKQGQSLGMKRPLVTNTTDSHSAVASKEPRLG
ncbi:DNA repair protein rad52 [Mortierella antarctica]|nr:DNA repair protein rad52 [Mortierella antarctica]